jgi:diguanylate cyclase (GGDEF)-like protein
MTPTKTTKIYLAILFIISTSFIFYYFTKWINVNIEMVIIFIAYFIFAMLIKNNTNTNIIIKGININIVIHSDVLLVILTNPLFNFVYLIINEIIDFVMNKDEKWNEKVWFFLYNLSSFNIAGIASFYVFQLFFHKNANIDIYLIIAVVSSILTFGIVSRIFFMLMVYFSNGYKKINLFKLTLIITIFHITINTPIISVIIYFLAMKEYIGILLVLILDFSLTFITKKSNEFTKGLVETAVYKEIAYKDQLTNVYNRHYLNSLLSDKSLLNGNLGIAIIDIDFFKKINDNYNHDVGDQVLKQFARATEKGLKDNDILIRAGGEEFIVFFKNKSFNDCYDLLNKIRTNIDSEQIKVNFNNEDVFIKYTVSSGLYYETINNDVDIKNALIEADNLLYNSKKNGRNRITSNKIYEIIEVQKEKPPIFNHQTN